MQKDCQFAQTYEALVEGPVLVDRSYRGLLEVSGADRASWLHNLTTNHVKTLAPGDGHYAFALNVKGRILFDLNIIVRTDTLWLDIDRRFLSRASDHFNKYIIMEDAQLVDRSDDYVRVALCGRLAAERLAELGASHHANLPQLGSAEVSVGGTTVQAVRNDFCGPWSVDLFLPVADAPELQATLLARAAVDSLIDDTVVQCARIEAGISWPGHEISEEYLPAETGRFDQAVAANKGCYLGQEIVERMRSRDAVARQLVGLEITGPAVPPVGIDLVNESESVVGKLTSACRLLASERTIGLAYVKTAHASSGSQYRLVWDDGEAVATLVDLPFSRA